MDPEDYGLDVMDVDDDVFVDEDEEEDVYDVSDADEVDDMLDALMSEEADEDDLAERRRRRRRGRRRSRRRGVRTARGRSAYRAPVGKGYVTQKQFKDALGRVGADVKRNASGIKTVNTRVGKLGSRVDGVVSVNRVQSKEIGKVQKLMKLDGALDLASSLALGTDETSGATTLTPDFNRLLSGALKSGFLGDGKGALSNPWAIGGLGFVLRNADALKGMLTSK